MPGISGKMPELSRSQRSKFSKCGLFPVICSIPSRTSIRELDQVVDDNWLRIRFDEFYYGMGTDISGSSGDEIFFLHDSRDI